jgi:nucleoside phosphorylase
MDEICFQDPCLLFAVRRESAPFLREFRPTQRVPGAPCWGRFCGPTWLGVLVLETGVGPAAARRALDWLLRPAEMGGVPLRPRVVLSAGFAGALQEGYGVGDILLATEVATPDGRSWPTTWPDRLPADFGPLHRGRLLTAATLVGDPEEKARLGQKHQAVAIDMESATVAELCRKRDVPFACVRAISDDVRTRLSPRLVSLLSGGRVSAWRLTAALARAPWLAAELARLRRPTAHAAERLGKALGDLLTLTLSWTEDATP